MATAGGGQPSNEEIGTDLMSPLMIQALQLAGNIPTGLGLPKITAWRTIDDHRLKSVKVTLSVLKPGGSVIGGMSVTVVISEIEKEKLPCLPLEDLKRAELDVLRPLVEGKLCTSPPDVQFAKVVYLDKGAYYLVKIITEVTAERKRLIQLKEALDERKAADAQIAQDKKNKAEAVLCLAKEKAHLAEKLALKQKQDALTKEASQRGFPDVASMLAADAKEAAEQVEVRRQQREAEKAVRDQADAATTASELSKKAEKARERHAANLAKKDAERQANFGTRKGYDSSRSPSTSPPAPLAARQLEGAE